MADMLDRTPLRLKLVAAILLLVTFALLVIGAASVFVVRGYLVARVPRSANLVCVATRA